MEEGRLGAQLVEPVAEAIRRDCGELWARALRPFLRPVLRQCVAALKKDIDEVLDLDRVVLTAFLRDKQVLVDLFQRVGAAELDFLVKSGLYLGFLLGVGQAAVWTVVPRPYTLPIAGALVGYVTNWLAIKLLFEPAEPTPVGPVTLQGLFEQRQPEVSAEFALFLSERVLTSPRLLDEMANGSYRDEFMRVLRRTVPFFVPDRVVAAAAEGVRDLAREGAEHPTHVYVAERMDIRRTLERRLKRLSPKKFEDLLHPVFQEDEIILIVVGGVLGAIAGFLQLRYQQLVPPRKVFAA